MLDDFRALAVFVSVADEGGFSQAGRILKISPSVVSHHIGKLEERLGVALFFRSTRSMSLTLEGQQILEHARRMVTARQDAIDSIASETNQLVGSLRVTVPTFVIDTWIYERILQFTLRHPNISLDIKMTDSAVDLINQRYDLAVRFGVLKDSALKSRRIGQFERVLVASPAYLATVEPINEITDLKRCVFVAMSSVPTHMTFIGSGNSHEFKPRHSRFQINSVSGAKAAVLAGLGIQRLPLFAVQKNIADGSLAHVLPQWALETLGVYAVWPETGPRKLLTQKLLEFLTEDGAAGSHGCSASVASSLQGAPR